ncbi:uncharacterized protein LOC127856924 isoform X2 [Dreissena polymorpha]|uniref:uncharacterized protein LOC127856924 isoform X2 n=1 Tax=Dreissena polymorpha TaxID=45954 RepID=UPI002264A083|nr:uncharacterized protein LOC127856924 isoform X2 [Dreissena polymorpha]
MGNCPCTPKRTRNVNVVVEESAEEMERRRERCRRERRRQLITDLAIFAVNEDGLNRVMENGFEALNSEELTEYYWLRDTQVDEFADDVNEVELLVLGIEAASVHDLGDDYRPHAASRDVMPVESSASAYLEVLQIQSVIDRFNRVTTFIPFAGSREPFHFVPRCYPRVTVTPNFDDQNSNDPDVWVVIVMREMMIRSVAFDNSESTSPECRNDTESSISSEILSSWVSDESDTSSSTDSDVSSTDSSSSEVATNTFHGLSYDYFYLNHRVRRSIFILEENQISNTNVDTSLSPFPNSFSTSTSSFSLSFPGESTSRDTQSPVVKSSTTVNSVVKEAHVQEELQSASNAGTKVERPFHSEDNDEKSANVKYSKYDFDEMAVDNSCAWFWCKTHKDEAITVKIVENPKYVRRINKEVTQNATAPVFERDPHLPNTTCVESNKSKEIESDADALSDGRDTSPSPFRNSFCTSTSSYSLCYPDERDSRETQSPVVKNNTTVTSFVKEAHVQSEFQNDTQEEPPFHNEDNDETSENVENCKGDVDEIYYDDKATNVQYSKYDFEDMAVDNSCAWFWCKTHKDEAITVKIVENPKYVRKINKEETQNAEAAVFERDSHTLNTTRVEICKSHEIESVADALPDVQVEEGKQSKIAKLLRRFFRRK